MRTLWSMVALLAFTFAAGCSTVGHTEAGIENFDRVSPAIFRGAQPTDDGFRTLAGYGVKTVINLADNDPHEAAVVQQSGMKYVSLPQDASAVTLADAENFLAILPTVPGPVFVHCHAGRDRTGLAIAAYRLRIEHWTAAAALQDLYQHGHNWALFPKVREVVASLATAQPAENPLAQSAPRLGAQPLAAGPSAK